MNKEDYSDLYVNSEKGDNEDEYFVAQESGQIQSCQTSMINKSRMKAKPAVANSQILVNEEQKRQEE